MSRFSAPDRSPADNAWCLGSSRENRARQALTVLEGGALSDLDNVAVRIADVAASLAVLGDWRREELGPSTFPQFIARLNIRNAEIHKAVDVIRIGDAERYRRLIRGRPASNVPNHPDIRKLKVPWRVAVTQAQNASAEDLFVVASRSLDVGDGEKMRDTDPLSRGHFIALLADLYFVHRLLQFGNGISPTTKVIARRYRTIHRSDIFPH